MDWMTYLKDISKEIGTAPTTRTHAEYILIDLLRKTSFSVTIQELKERNGNILPRPSKNFNSYLIKETENTRAVSGNDKYVFTPEDIGDSFSVRKQIDAIRDVKTLKEMGKDLKIPGYTKAKANHTWKLRKALEVHPDIKIELAKIRTKYPSKFNNVYDIK